MSDEEMKEDRFALSMILKTQSFFKSAAILEQSPGVFVKFDKF